MTFNFEGGDILVLLLVFILLYLIRRSDKTSRTIEGVKNYAKKSTQDLENLFAEHKTALQDLVNELEIQEETNRRIFAKHSDTWQDINVKTEEINEKMEKIKSYEPQIEALGALAQKVDENLARLKEESKYVDKVGQNLNDLRSNLSSLEEKDRIRFEAFQKNLVSKFSSNLQKMENQIEQSHNQFVLLEERLTTLNSQHGEIVETQKNHFKEALQDIMTDFHERLEKVAEEGSRMESDAFTTLNEKINSQVQELEHSWINAINPLRERMSFSEAEIQQGLKSLHEEMDMNAHQYQEQREDMQSSITMIQDNLAQFEKQLETVLSNYSSQLEDSRNSATVHIDEELKQYMDTARDNINTNLKNLDDSVQRALSELNGSFDERIKTSMDKFDTKVESVNGKIQSTSENFDVKLEELQKMLHSDEFNFDARFQEALATAHTDLNTRLDEMDNRIQNASNDFDAKEKELDSMKDKIQITIDNIQDSFEKRIQDTDIYFDNSLEQLKERVEKAVILGETNFLEKVDQRQDEYKKIIEGHFSGMEESIADMDNLVLSLQSSQTQMLKEVEQAFQVFDEEMQERRGREEDALSEKTEQIRQDMNDLEHGLDELKSTAYGEMSKKLQVFEDGFFADLRDRDAKMRNDLEEWHGEANSQMDRMRAEMEKWRKNIEREIGEAALQNKAEWDEDLRQYMLKFKQEFSEFQSRILTQFETVQDQVDRFRTSLTERIKASEGEITSFRDTFSERIAVEKESSLSEFEKTFETFNNTTEERFTKARTAINKKLAESDREFESHRKELMEKFLETQNEASVWMEQLSLKMSEIEQNTTDIISNLKADTVSKMSELQDQYSERVARMVYESDEERGRLKREIAEIEESITHLSSELMEKSRDTVNTLQDQSNTSLLEFRKSSRDAREEMERKIKELRESIQDTRERAESNRKDIVVHVDSERNRLMKTLEEIERKQKDFIAETQIFDRAEKMKEALAEDMAELSRQLETVKAGQVEVRSINNQYERSLNLYEDVRDKMTQFLAEQQKVETLEVKLSRIRDLSNSVDLKLNEMNDTSDSLQDLQVQVKKMQDMQEDLDKHYERLSGKSTVLDSTSDRVDKNFRQMTELDNNIKLLSERLTPIQSNLTEFEEKQQKLETDNEKIEALTEKVSTLDSTMLELEERFATLTKAREWLAKTETRLSDINRETQQHLRLLGTLTSKQTARKQTGSPDMSTREMVVKLARQGWSSDEIAQSTKLSKGEVELILELTPH